MFPVTDEVTLELFLRICYRIVVALVCWSYTCIDTESTT